MRRSKRWPRSAKLGEHESSVSRNLDRARRGLAFGEVVVEAIDASSEHTGSRERSRVASPAPDWRPSRVLLPLRRLLHLMTQLAAGAGRDCGRRSIRAHLVCADLGQRCSAA